MEASTQLAGARPAALASAARFLTDVGAPGAARTARKLYRRALELDPHHAPTLQARVSAAGLADAAMLFMPSS